MAFVASTSHNFELHTYKFPTICGHCNNLLVGVSKQGLHCKRCKFDIHESCQSNLIRHCINLAGNRHNFRVKTIKTPTNCDYCGKLLLGFFNQGLKCSECRAVIHNSCQSQLDSNCDKVKSRLQAMRNGSIPS